MNKLMYIGMSALIAVTFIGLIVAMQNCYADNYGMSETTYAQNQAQYTCSSPNGYACEEN